MADLRTHYLGMELRNPVVLSACPLSDDVAVLQQFEEAGVGAVVIRSLFEEQIEREAAELLGLMDEWSDSYVEAESYFPTLQDFRTGPESYLQLVSEARRRLRVPVIASLNGSSPGGWVRYAKNLEDAGAHALELNIYAVAADPEVSGAEVEARYVEMVAAVRSVVSIPLAVKIGPFFSSLPHVARQLVAAGAGGLVLFNRFLQPDLNLEAMTVEPTMRLSTSEEFRLPLRWVAILYGRLEASLAATTGVHSASEALKALAAGADAVMLASALLQQGPALVPEILHGMDEWLERNEYLSVEQLKGCMSQLSCPEPAAFERAHYMRAIVGYAATHAPRAGRRMAGDARFRGPRA